MSDRASGRARRTSARRRAPAPAVDDEVDAALDPFVTGCASVLLVVGAFVGLLGLLGRVDPRLLLAALPPLVVVGVLWLRHASRSPAGLAPDGSASGGERVASLGAAPRRRIDRLRGLALHLTRGRLDEAEPGQVTVHGRVRGRDASLVAPRSTLRHAGEAVTLRCRASCPFDARIAPNPLTGELTARCAQAADAGEADRRLRGEDVARDLAALFSSHDAELVEVRGGELVVTIRLWRVVPARLERALERVVSLARALERSPSPGLAPVMVPRAGPDASRCPFCRDPLAGAGTVVACHRCRTRLHDACWRELGRCTATGCTCELASPVAPDEPGISLGPLPCASCGSRERGCAPGDCRAPRRRGWRRRV